MTEVNDPSLWWKQAVVYQVYPRSFKDSRGEGLGQIAGVTEKIGYLKELGVDAIWLSPFYPSQLADGGYDVDFTKLAKIEMPESYFGTWISDDGQTKVIASKGHLSVAINGGELVEATEASYDEFGVYFTIDGVEYSLSSSYGEDNQIFFANSDYSFRCMLTLQA